MAFFSKSLQCWALNRLEYLKGNQKAKEGVVLKSVEKGKRPIKMTVVATIIYQPIQSTHDINAMHHFA